MANKRDRPVVEASGGVVTRVGPYTIHTFNASSTFVSLGTITVDHLIVAGGGSGSSANYQGGGGGAGGVIQGTVTLAAGTYPILVGNGGINSLLIEQAAKGANSSYNGLVAIGGGQGSFYPANPSALDFVGGSGGGACYTGATGSAAEGTAGQGNRGGYANPSAPYYQCGGGGAGSVGYSGLDSTPANVSKGGDGILSSISGVSIYYAGGGGGSAYTTGGGSGGIGGGGAAGGNAFGEPLHYSGYDGGSNTGGGGGAAQSHTSTQGGNGGSGIVILRYLAP
jgi:hypothetical protein